MIRILKSIHVFCFDEMLIFSFPKQNPHFI